MNKLRYVITDVVSIPIMRLSKKGEAYRQAIGDGWGTVSYEIVNGKKVAYCNEDSSAVLYPVCGKEFCIFPDEEINLKDAPKQAEVDAIITSDPCGYAFWAKDEGDVKIFVTYDENGLIDNFRLDNWSGKPYDGETEISFNDLQSEEEYDKTNRSDIIGTLEHERKLKEAAA
jgi:hypothetical protein